MKIGGREIKGPMEEVIVLPRGEGEDDIVFKAKAVLDAKRYRELCPEPKPRKMIKRGVGEVDDLDNPSYKAAVDEHNKLYTAFLVIESLKSTEGLEWDTVDDEDPSTWQNYEEDLKNAGFSDFERARILAGVMAANALNENTIKQARERFFRGQEAAANASSSPSIAQKTTPFSVPANDSA